jgi:hypothetical protein
MKRRLPDLDIRLASTSAVVGVLLVIISCAMLLPARDVEMPIELLKYERERGPYHPKQTAPRRFEAPVTLTMPVAWEKVDRLVILVSLSRRALPLADASLVFPDISCSFQSSQSTLYDDGELVLEPAQCEESVEAGKKLTGRLTIEFASPHSLALVALECPAEAGGLMRLGEGDADGQAPYLMGRFVTSSDQDSVSRAEQVAAIWSLPWLSWATPLVVCFAVLLASAGGIILSLRLAPRRNRVLAAGMFALSLGIMYVVLVPPFHAPDEPDHFLAFARIAQMPELESSARELAQSGHFERIHFHRWERFLPNHMDEPYPTPWTEVDDAGIIQVADSGMETRSTLTTRLWEKVAFLFRDAGAATTLLGLRLINAALWSLACMLGVWLSESIASKHSVFPLFLFFIPSLPFFAMHISNFAQYAHVLTIAGCFNLGLFLRGERLQSGGVMLGLLSSTLVLSASSGVVMLGWTACMAIGRLIVVIRDKAASIQSAAMFWFGIVLGLAFMLAFINDPQFERLETSLRAVLAMLDLSNGERIETPILAAALLACGATGMLTELFLVHMSRMLYPIARHVVIWGNRLLALGLGVLLLYAPYTQYEIVPSNMDMVSVKKYIYLGVYNMFSTLTFRQPDLMLSTTFWSGFGWHDVLFDPVVVQILAGVSGCGLFLAMACAGSDYRRSARMLGAVIGALISGTLMVLVVASGVGGGQPNIHGRYLLGSYMIALSLAFAGFIPAVWRFVKGNREEPGMAFGWRGQRTGIELIMSWSALVAAGMTMYMAGWPWIFPTLSVPLVWLYFLFAIGAPFFCALMIRLLLRETPAMRIAFVQRSPRIGYYVSLWLIVFSSLVITELMVTLPKAAIFRFDFYTLLPTIVAALLLLRLYRLSLRGALAWLAPGAFLAGAIIHAGSLMSLLKRYFG